MTVPTRVYFDAVLTPHRALSARGFALLMLLVAGASFAAGLYFYWRNAWPVIGFLGLDVLLVYVALRANFASARMAERVVLTGEALTVTNVVAGRAPAAWRFEPAWTQIRLEEGRLDEARLSLWSHGRGVEIGAFLAPAERRGLAAELREALATRAAELTSR